MSTNPNRWCTWLGNNHVVYWGGPSKVRLLHQVVHVPTEYREILGEPEIETRMIISKTKIPFQINLTCSGSWTTGSFRCPPSASQTTAPWSVVVLEAGLVSRSPSAAWNSPRTAESSREADGTSKTDCDSARTWQCWREWPGCSSRCPSASPPF